MGITERLNQLVKYLGLTPRAFALKIGTSSQAMSNYLAGRDPSFEVVCKLIETFVEISPDWLITGRGPMLRDEQPPIPTLHTPPEIEASPPPASVVYERDPDDAKRIADLEKDVKTLKERLADKDETIVALKGTIREKSERYEEREKYVVQLELANGTLRPSRYTHKSGTAPTAGTSLVYAQDVEK